MLSPSIETVRLFLHILGATVWVGGQLTMLGLLPVLRAQGPDLPRLAARQFGKIAWAGFALAVVTGVWNVFEVDMKNASTSYHMTLGLKLVLVGASAAAALVHSYGKSKPALAIGGAVGLVASLGAVFVGVLLAG